MESCWGSFLTMVYEFTPFLRGRGNTKPLAPLRVVTSRLRSLTPVRRRDKPPARRPALVRKSCPLQNPVFGSTCHEPQLSTYSRVPSLGVVDDPEAAATGCVHPPAPPVLARNFRTPPVLPVVMRPWYPGIGLLLLCHCR